MTRTMALCLLLASCARQPTNITPATEALPPPSQVTTATHRQIKTLDEKPPEESSAIDEVRKNLDRAKNLVNEQLK